jgi:hypothetical protein
MEHVASLQIPYLLSLALLVAQYLPSFPPSQKSTFRLLGKLDIAFASLLQGRHVETGELLPGFETGRKVNGTEKVRMKSLVDQTRMTVMDVIGIAGTAEEEDEDDKTETETETEDEFGFGTEDEMDVDREVGNELDVEEYGEREMGVARIYDRTVVELGDTLVGSPIGIITDD